MLQRNQHIQLSVSSAITGRAILLNLNAWLYRMLCLRCGGCAEVQCRYGCVSVGF